MIERKYNNKTYGVPNGGVEDAEYSEIDEKYEKSLKILKNTRNTRNTVEPQ